MHLKEKICKLNNVFQATGLIFTFININLLTEIFDEIEIQKALQKELGYTFIRVNPDEENFSIFKEINKIQR